MWTFFELVSFNKIIAFKLYNSLLLATKNIHVEMKIIKNKHI